MASRKSLEEKKRPIGSFNIPFNYYQNISLSGKDEFREKLDKYLFENKLTITDFALKLFLKGLKKVGINSFDELMKQSGIKEQERDEVINKALKQYLGIENISLWFETEAKKEMKDEKINS